MASFRSEKLSIQLVKNKLLNIKKNNFNLLMLSTYDPEFKTLIFFIYLINEMTELKSINDTFEKLESINFLNIYPKQTKKNKDISVEDFIKLINVIIKNMCTLVKPEQTVLFTQLCNTATDLILSNYKTIPFEMSAISNLKNDYDAKVTHAIQQCRLIEQCHEQLRKLFPNSMSQFAVLLNNLLLPLEK
ncbi:hypothetical protein FACS1894166_05360 [Bacilli bacterium]|nr:hypothetical protein FACS1894166_05360 [Bacilli bacterium]